MPDHPPDILNILALRLADGVGPATFFRALERFGSPEHALAAAPSAWAAVPRVGEKSAERIVRSFPAARDEAARTLDRCDALGLRVLTRACPDYPALLRLIDDAPPVLFVRGALAHAPEPAVAIVGSRKATAYGIEQAERFAAAFAQHHGLAVVSGGARGIDTAAHRAALRVNGRTVVVLGAGHACPYPPENTDLFDRVVHAGGAVLSELTPDTAPARENFPTRNRIISGLSLGVLVVEAPERSGALITARLAVEEHGRTALALPGRVDSPTSRGANALIRSGSAALVASPADAADELDRPGAALIAAALEHAPTAQHASQSADHLFIPPTEAANPPSASNTTAPATTTADPSLAAANLSDRQRTILDALDGPTNWDDLARRTGLDVAVLRADATILEIRGLIRRTGSALERRTAAH